MQKLKLFRQLAKGQKPLARFITCSDSRISPNLITNTEPSELFILRNAGNIVPPCGTANGGEAPTVEFAVAGLGVRDIIVCGHSHCGAMNGLLHPERLGDLPSVAAWLGHAEATRRVVNENYKKLGEAKRLNVAIQENVLAQIENLRTHPAVAARLSRGELTLHGWVYKIETGDVFAYSVEQGQFIPLAEYHGTPSPAVRRQAIRTI